MAKNPKKPAAKTPLMQQYLSIKQQHPEALLLFRLGDFYEMFYEDAVTAAKELEITLTSRHKESGNPVPMCGVPYHSIDGYIARLIRRGYKVAVCEQTEAPTKGKKLVAREVVRVITPGTAYETGTVEPRENNYLAACFPYPKRNAAGLAYADLSTGRFRSTEITGDDWQAQLIEELRALAPREVLRPQSGEFAAAESRNGWANRFVETPVEDWIFDLDHAERALCEQFEVKSLDGFGLKDLPLATGAAGAILHYLQETQKKALPHIEPPRIYQQSETLVLDSATVLNLELVEPLTGNDNATTLLAALDETQTALGARMLRRWLQRPANVLQEIEVRLDAVEELTTDEIGRGELRETLSNIADLERLLSRCTLESATPRDLVSLRNSLGQFPRLLKRIEAHEAARLKQLHNEIDPLDDLRTNIAATISDEPPPKASDLGIIRAGFDAELDELRGLRKSGQQYIAQMEARERKRTGIGSLKVRFNNVFGYYIEVSKANRDRVPADYDRKQTLVNAERYITPELKEYEVKVLTAEDQIAKIEKRLFTEVRVAVTTEATRIRATAAAIAQLDVLASFAHLARARNYTRAKFMSGGEMSIAGGRHPVLERLMEQSGERFVPNDLYLNQDGQFLLLVTGPNMGGKSTYLRQTALICLLAQMGSFVPAREARLPLLDRIYTRIGAADNLARGRSTFLVEMTETATILNTATENSLVLLDEIGRGTATYDGLAIAWAVVEFLHGRTRARTLFATHYHELTELADLLDGVGNIHVAVKESGDGIVFLHRIEEGSASKSYGIEVAKLAGLPHEVIERAAQVLTRHEQAEGEITHDLTPGGHPDPGASQLSLLPLLSSLDQEVVDEIRKLDLDGLKPLDALNLLAEIKRRLKES